MEMNLTLPEEMLISIGTETKEFAFRSRLRRPVSRSVGRVIFGLVWLSFISFFVYLFLGPILSGEESEMIVNGETKIVSLQNLKPALPVIIFLGVFVMIGLIMLIPGLFSMFARGGWFAGTPTRLVWYHKGVLKSLDWSQFNGNIEIRGSNQKANMTLEMRTGRMQSTKGGSRYVPDIVYFVGIPDAYEIERIIRRRIEENTPK